MKLQKKRTREKKLRQRNNTMKDYSDTSAASQGSMYDPPTQENLVLDLGDHCVPSLTSANISTITLDDLQYLPNDTITLPSTTWDATTYTISGGGGGSNYSAYNWNTSTNVHIDADGLTMKEGADIKIGGKSLTAAIEKIEERLGILKPNPELEDRWEKLRELRNQYIEMEKDLLEKEKIMKILKEA